jgi:hypothetical protein
MTRKPDTKVVLEGEYAAEIDVELLIDDDGWSPYLTVEDAMRLETIRELLRQADLQAAAKLGRVFRLVPVAA